MQELQLGRRNAAQRGPAFQGPAGVLAVPAHDAAGRDVAMLVAGETSGRPLDEVLQEFACSRQVYEERLQAFREQGLAGLLAGAPKSRDQTRPQDIVRYIVTARLRDPARAPSAIAADLERMGFRVSPRSVERTLQGFGLFRRTRPL
jgi:transposase